MISQSLYLGIDGGGTKCKARLEDESGNLLGEGLAGPANPVRGVELTINSILDASHQALSNAGVNANSLPPVIAGIGLAGVNLPNLMTELNNWEHPFADMYLTTDLHIACLGAHGGQDGAVIITGTGFCAGSLIDGKVTEIGGHGFILGDTASGARLGLNALRYCMQYFDGLVLKDKLIEALLDALQVSNATALVEKSMRAKPAFFAKFAPLVLQHADLNNPLAIKLVDGAADYVNQVAHNLMAGKQTRISMIGGIAEPLKKWLDPNLQGQLSNPISPPEVGALYLARQKRI